MTAPAAGWYRDPADSGAWRWWDGASWTDHLRVVETPAQTGPVTTAPETAPVQTSPVQTGPVPTGPVPTAPVQPAAAEATPAAQPTPVQAAPPQAAPPQPAPPHAAPAAPASVQPDQVVIEPVPTHPPVFDQIAPTVAPEPATASAPAAPVVATAIPEPGQIAPPPEVRYGNVSLTPAIPVTDQMYWHSAAAEKIEVPRLTHTSSAGSPRSAAPAYVRDWNDLGSPQTAGVWLLAVSPVLYQAVAFLVGVAQGLSGGAFGPYPLLVVFAVTTGLNWIFAYIDQRQLRERGYHPAPIGWMLLVPPIAYLIARGRVVRHEGKSAWPPELVFVLTFGAFAALSVLSRLGSLGFGG